MRDINLKQIILDAIGNQPDLRQVILFGSMATGAENARSDIDLAVDTGHRLTADEKMALITVVAEKTGRPIDLVDLHSVGEPILGQILRHGIRIMGDNTSYANLLRKHLFEQADFLPYRNRILAERRQAWTGK